MTNEYTVERIQMALAPRQVRYLPSVASTNDEAANWLVEGAASGSVVVADEQNAGRGRHGRTWHTPPGVALALSVILHPPQEHMAGINMAGTLAVFRALSVLHLPDVHIKWANDVLVGGKKISGVLPEAIWNGDQLQGMVLGIGVNGRNTFEGTPLQDLATSIEAETQRPIDRVSLLAVLLFQLDHWLAMLGTDALTAAYKSQMTMLGQPVTVTGETGDIRGTALDVEKDGALTLRLDNGDLKRVYAGDVTVKRSN